MKRKKWIAALLTLLMMLSLAPAALAAEALFPTDLFAGLGANFSLRSMIDPDKGDIEIAGSSLQLENIIFFDEAVVDEESEICLCETSKDAMILDDTALPEGMRAEIREEEVRIPDGRDGVWVAEEIRRERANQPAQEEPKLDPSDSGRKAYYLYLVGKPAEVGESLFVLWDGKIRLCSVTVLAERPEPKETPAPQEQPTQPTQPEPSPEAAQETITQEWVDPWANQETITQEWVDPAQQSTPPATDPPAPFILPTPSVTVTGNTNVTQGDSAELTAQVSNDYNTSYQWYIWNDAGQSWQILDGQTGTQLRPDTSAAGTWAYLCQVTNNGPDGQTANAYCEPVVVQVGALPAPTVTGVTGSTKVEQGDSAVLEVHATDTFNASYQWYENDKLISGATSSQYQPDTSVTGTQTYVCEVTNTYDSGLTTTAKSEPVTFTVEAKPAPAPVTPTPTPVTPTPAPAAQIPALPKPSVTITGGTSVYVRDNAVLEAKVTNGYNVSYQWYQGVNSKWEAIDENKGGTAARFKPDTSRAGMYAYLCRVISSDGYGQSHYADSEPIVFTVADRPVVTPTPTPTPTPYVNKTVTGISVAKLPNKIEYNDGEAVDASGLQIRVRYADNTSNVIDSGFIVTTTNVSYNNSGLANVNVNYRGYQTSYQVKVHSVAELIRSIGVLTMPNKSSYTVGEYLNTAGLKIRVYSTDGRYLDVGEGFDCSPTYFSSPGNQTVTVSFMGKTCTFTVAVQQAKRVTGLTIQSLPANRSYTVGDTISTAGLVLQLQTTSGYETVTSGFTISPRVATTAGSQQITVNYEGLSTSYTIDVRSNIPYAAPSPTPTPYGMTPTPMPFGVTPSPAPFGTVSPSPSGFPMPSASVSPAPTPLHTPTPARRNTGVSTAVKVLFAVAVVALGGLIGYVIYLRKTGDEEGFLDEPKLSEKLRNLFRKK